MTTDQFYALSLVCWLTAVVAYPLLRVMRKQPINFLTWLLLIALPVGFVFFVVVTFFKILFPGDDREEELYPKVLDDNDPANNIPAPCKPDAASQYYWHD